MLACTGCAMFGCVPAPPALTRCAASAANLASTSLKDHGSDWNSPLRTWALVIKARGNRNKAVCALTNKMARICYATLRDHEPYGAARLERKIQHTAFKRTD